MRVPIWVAERAQEFWAGVGELEGFPRNLVRSINRSVPLSVVFLSHVTIGVVLERLRRVRVVCDVGVADRRLRACLVARDGHGFAFIDGTDPDDEKRYSVAHELAHFLKDYMHPRMQIVDRVGPQAAEILDGLRPATAEERLVATLRGSRVGFHIHLMDREDDGTPASGAIAHSEQCADRLAYELLAPAEHVHGTVKSVDVTSVIDTLVSFYGLPTRHAARYARELVPQRPTDPILARLQKAKLCVDRRE